MTNDLNQFNIIRDKLTYFIALEGQKRLYSKIYGVHNSEEKEVIRKEALLYAYSLNTYEMNPDGSTTGKINYLTDNQLKDILLRVEQICGEINV